MAKINCQENGSNQLLQSENIWGILHKTIFPLPLPGVGAGAEGFVWEEVTHGSLGKTRRSRALPCRRVGRRGQALCRWWNRICEAIPDHARLCQAMPDHTRQLHSPLPGMDGSNLLRKAEMCHTLLESIKAPLSTFTCPSMILFPISWCKWRKGTLTMITAEPGQAGSQGWYCTSWINISSRSFTEPACHGQRLCRAATLHTLQKDPGREIMFSHCFPNYFKCQLKRLLRFLFQTEVLTGTARGS